MTESGFYQLLDREMSDHGAVEVFSSNEHVQSPWGPIQHGGPVAALLTRAMDRLTERSDSRLTRVTIEILGPVPISDVRVSARVVRPGKKIALVQSVLEAKMPDGTWRDCALGSAWRQATQDTADVVNHANAAVPAHDESTLPDVSLFPIEWMSAGFVASLDIKVARTSFTEGEPSIAWMKLARDLVQGEETTALEQLMALADTTNGVGARLDPAHFRFLNTEMTVHLYGAPVDDWFGIEAETSVGADGVGLSASVLHSTAGPIGRVAQSLLVERVTSS